MALECGPVREAAILETGRAYASQPGVRDDCPAFVDTDLVCADPPGTLCSLIIGTDRLQILHLVMTIE